MMAKEESSKLKKLRERLAARKKVEVVEEAVEEKAPEPVVELSKEPEPEAPLKVSEPAPALELNPLPYLKGEEEPIVTPPAPVEEEPPAAPAAPPAPPVVVEGNALSLLEGHLRSMDELRLRVVAERHGIAAKGKGREELIAAILAAQEVRAAVVPPPVAEEAAEARKLAPYASVVSPTHSFLLGPGEKPEMVSAGGPLLPPAPVRPEEEAPKLKVEERPVARKPYSSL